MQLIARTILELAAALITLGGLFDLLVSRLPENLAEICADIEPMHILARELLRALGSALFSIGVAVGVLVYTSPSPLQPFTLLIILILVIPTELINAYCMYRVNSPFYFPLLFAVLTGAGVALAWNQLPQ